MKTYISLLRGINVSGQKKIKMEELRKLYENLGFTDVKSYIQSGNLIFQYEEEDIGTIQEKIEKVIQENYEFEVKVLVLTPSDLQEIFNQNPFEEEQVYFTFLYQEPESIPTEAIEKVLKDSEKYAIQNQVIYFSCPEGYGRTKFSNNFIESKLKVDATTRNLKTVIKLLDLSKEQV